MKEAIVHSGPKVEIIDSPYPKITADQVLIKVVVSGSNPKDWKRPKFMNKPHNSGDDIAGFVELVGDNVTEFKKGDRVAAFHEMMADYGSFAEYAVSEAHTTFHLPNKTSFEEAATIPLAAMTAAIGLYLRLGLPEPWKPATKPTPLIVYGGSGAVGAFAIKLAKASNIHPIIAVAGKGQDFVETLIDRSKGDEIVDYRKGDEAVVSGIEVALKAAGIGKAEYAYDGISEKGSYQNICKVLAPGGKFTTVLPPKDFEIPNGIQHTLTMVAHSHKDLYENLSVTGSKDFAFVGFRLFSRGLQEGWFTGHPYEVVPGGLRGVEKGLADLQEGKASAVKYVFKIEDTK